MTKRTRSVLLAILLCGFGLWAISWTLCSPQDVTDDPVRSSGYRRNQIYTLKVDVLYESINEDGSGNVGSLYRPEFMNSAIESRQALLKFGTHIKLISVSRVNPFPWRPAGFNVIKAIMQDGPLSGKTVYIEGISSPKPNPLYRTRDPNILD